jgi:hypothetical protein
MPEDSPLHWTNVFRTFADQISPQVAEEIVKFRVSEEAQARYDDLANKNTEGLLTESERLELDEFVTLYRMISILKARARASIHGQAAA